LKPLLFCCAESASLDNITKTISLYHILTKVELGANEPFPRVFPRLTIALIARKEDTETSSQVFALIAKYDAQILHQTPLNVDFQDKNTINLIVNVVNFPIHGFGRIIFEIRSAEKLIADYELEIVVQSTNPLLPTGVTGTGVVRAG
jgi:hypothetical protein